MTNTRFPFLLSSLLAASLTVPAAGAFAQQGPPGGGGPQQGRPQPSTRPAQGRPSAPGNRPGPGQGQGPGNQKPGNRPGPGRPGGTGGQGNARPQPSRPVNRPPQNRPGRPPQWGRPPQNRPNYAWRPNDRTLLMRHYRNRLRYVNRSRRPVFVVGGYFPYADIGYLTPLPVALYGQLPPPPPGYQMGYWDGYVIVYDPVTYFIANLIDLM